MKRILLLSLLLLGMLPSVRASHIAGGEITWECQPTGEFVFQLTLYRYCSGALLDPSYALEVHDHPSISSIQVNLIDSVDLTPECISGQPLNCNTGSPGAVEKMVYESAPIQMSGVPGPQGWTILWTSCCRQPTIGNLANPFSQGTTIYSTMYNWQNTNMYPCFDNSPTWDAEADPLTCNNAPASLHPNGSDADLDSLVFELIDPLDELTGAYVAGVNPTAVGWQTGYSTNAQLPGWQGFDPITGVLQYAPNAQGLYTYALAVKAYRNGQLISETMRETNVTVVNCAVNNTPVLAGNIDGVNHYDTVYVGDTLNLTLTGISPISDSVRIWAAGSRFSDTYSGQNDCDIPFCGTLSPTPDMSWMIDSATAQFQWVATNAHLSSGNAYTHLFTARFATRNCPVPEARSTTLAITVMPAPAPPPATIANFSYSGLQCSNEWISFANLSTWFGNPSPPTGAHTYAWDFGDGSSSTATNPFHQYAAAGSYTVSLVTTDTIGGADTATQTITINTTPNVTFSNPISACSSGSTYPVASMSIPGNIVSMDWWPAGAVDNASSFNPLYTGGTDTTLFLTATDGNGCTDIDTVDLVLVAPLGVAGPDVLICEGDTAQLSASGGVAYAWTPTATISDPTVANPTATPTSTTYYYVDITDANGCQFTDTLLVTVEPATAVWSYTASNLMVSFNEQNSNTNPQSMLWDFGDGATSMQFNPAHTYSAPGTYTVCLTVTYVCGTVTSCDTVVVTCPAPTADFSTSENGLDVTFTNNSTNATAYVWDFGDGNSATTTSPLHNYAEPGQYTVCLTASSACGADTLCDDVLLFPTDSVWPGDVDNDGVVNNFDVLPLGLSFGTTGPQRLNTSIMWQAWASFDWTQDFVWGTNYKYADCNGDGVIDWTDTTAIVANYSFVHSKNGGAPQTSGNDPLLFVENTTDTTGLNTAFSANIMLGQSGLPANNVYGLAFSLHYDPALVDSGSVSYSTSGSWMGTHNQDLLCIKKNFFDEGRIEVGMTRVDLTSVSGFGKIAEFGGITADNLSGKDEFEQALLPMWIDNVRLIDMAGNEMQLSLAGDSMVVIDSASFNGFNTIVEAPQLRVFPNPASDMAYISIDDKNASTTLRVLNSLGQQVEVVRANSPRWQLDTSGYPAGVYFAVVEHPSFGSLVRMLEVTH